MHAWVDMTVVGTMQREAATRDAEGRLLESGGLKLHRVCNPTTSSCHAPGTFREFKNQDKEQAIGGVLTRLRSPWSSVVQSLEFRKSSSFSMACSLFFLRMS